VRGGRLARLAATDQDSPCSVTKPWRTRDPHLALDLLSETFLAAFEHRDRCRADSEQEAAAWLYKIAANRLAAHYRRGAIERRATERSRICRSSRTCGNCWPSTCARPPWRARWERSGAGRRGTGRRPACAGPARARGGGGPCGCRRRARRPAPPDGRSSRERPGGTREPAVGDPGRAAASGRPRRHQPRAEAGDRRRPRVRADDQPRADDRSRFAPGRASSPDQWRLRRADGSVVTIGSVVPPPTLAPVHRTHGATGAHGVNGDPGRGRLTRVRLAGLPVSGGGPR
jgi:hypothetical protein